MMVIITADNADGRHKIKITEITLHIENADEKIA